MTPEGKVKKKVKEVLREHEAYFFMPVQNGMGMPSLDFIGCHRGFAYAIETKAPKKRLTPRQEGTRRVMEASGMKVFVIDDSTTEAVAELIKWLDSHTIETPTGGVWHRQA